MIPLNRRNNLKMEPIRQCLAETSHIDHQLLKRDQFNYTEKILLHNLNQTGILYQ